MDSAPTPEPSPAASPRRGRWDVVAAWIVAHDRALFGLYVAAAVGYVASLFYGSMLVQTGGTWSAPLDDVFIHFDYARATARGYPFQWSEGNGFSSGNTSLLYPFVLAIGYLGGFRGLYLVIWSALVAIGSLAGFLFAAARLFEPLGKWAKYLLVPAVLCVGALDWTLFSGMENAFHLGIWGLVLVAVLRLEGGSLSRAVVARRAWLVGLAGVLLVLTRPESVVSVASFGLLVAYGSLRRHGRAAALWTLVRVGAPGALALALQAVANRVYTGEWAAAGAIAKLALNNPYMTAEEKWNQYLFLLEYVLDRNARHHFGEVYPIGYVPLVLGLLPLFVKRLRPMAWALWAQVVLWSLLVALNGQVRWQNERYTMAAVAWVLLLGAMGLSVLVSRLGETLVGRAFWGLRVAVGLSAAGLFAYYEAPQFRDQLWFFGRASRNIRDQHLVAGKVLAGLGARRVLVGDAGALLYASDLPGLDIIGLGGYRDYPFARAGQHGLGASLELVERMPRIERPDVLAIYPSWWGDLPVIFGKRITSVPVYGNVICGGAEKVIYAADWSPMDGSNRPLVLRAGERIVDELDVADLMSEKAHDYQFPRPAMGFVGFRVLPHPRLPGRDLFDAGRHIPEGQSERATLIGDGSPARLVLRSVGDHATTAEVLVDGLAVGQLVVPESKGWVEVSLDLPARPPGPFSLELRPGRGGLWDAHVWLLGAE
jgi:hypothetical protein